MARSSTSCRASIRRAARSTASSSRRREELDHDFLWRCMKAAARAGPDRHLQPLVLRRSAGRAGAPGAARGAAAARRASRARSSGKARYDDINNFEQHLARNGTVVLKFFLHISKEEQTQAIPRAARRAGEALEVFARPTSPSGALGRLHARLRRGPQRDQHQVGAVVRHPGRPQMGHARAIVAGILTNTIKSLDLKYPQLSSADEAALEQARRMLENE